MQERDDDLRMEDQMERSGYFNWLGENIGDLKAEFMTQYSVEDLVQIFYWEEQTIEDFFNNEADEFDEYCKTAWDASNDWEQTKADLNRMIERV